MRFPSKGSAALEYFGLIDKASLGVSSGLIGIIPCGGGDFGSGMMGRGRITDRCRPGNGVIAWDFGRKSTFGLSIPR